MGSNTRGSTYQEDGPGEHLSGLSFLLCPTEVIMVRQEVQTRDAEGLFWSPSWRGWLSLSRTCRSSALQYR